MKLIKTPVRVFVYCCLGGLAAAAPTETNSFRGLHKLIPDGNASGLSDVRVVSSSIAELSSVRVRVRIDGQFNGDLYGYLRHVTAERTNFCVLLNRPGRTALSPLGYDDFGLDVLFDDTAPNGDIHLYQTTVIPGHGSPLTGVWLPDGRKISPFIVSDQTPPTTTLASFEGVPASGEWTLFVADLESGGTNALVSWELELTGRIRPFVSWPTPDDIIYGTALGEGQLNASSPEPGTFSYIPPAGAVLDAGASQVLAVTFVPADTDNYEMVTTNVVINVLRAPLVIVANDYTNVYGAPLPMFSAEFAGFVNGDGPESLDSPVILTTDAVQGSHAGTYSINVGGAVDSNYAVQFLNGRLTIVPARVSTTLASSANPAAPDETITFTFIATPLPPSTAPPPTGTVIFKVNGFPSFVSLVDGIATLDELSLSAGTHVVEVEYPGDEDFHGATNRLAPDQVINTQPIAAMDQIARYIPYSAKVHVATLLQNDWDADLDPISFVSAAEASAHGGTVIRQGNWISYTAPSGFTNNDSFTYMISDGRGHEAVGTVNVSVEIDELPSPNLIVTDLGNGSYRIRFDGVPNLAYRIECTDTFDPPQWQDLGSHPANSSGQFEFVDTPPVGFTQRFYRSVHP